MGSGSNMDKRSCTSSVELLRHLARCVMGKQAAVPLTSVERSECALAETSAANDALARMHCATPPWLDAHLGRSRPVCPPMPRFRSNFAWFWSCRIEFQCEIC